MRLPSRGQLLTILLLAFVASAWLVASARPGDLPADVAFQRDLEYASVGGEALKLNLALPRAATDRLPAVVVIHGGGWRAGDRADFDALTWRLAQAGFVAATVGYRFCPAHRFPAQVQDVQRAVRFLRDNAERYHVDPARIGAVGFSAGGHLAMLLGTLDPEDGLDERDGSDAHGSKVQAVVSYFGPTDLELPTNELTRPLLADLLGGPLDERRQDYRRASPLTYVDAGDAPMLLFQGTDDPLVPAVHATVMAEALQRAGVSGRVELLVGAGHGGWDDAELERTTQAMLAFLREHLGVGRADESDWPEPYTFIHEGGVSYAELDAVLATLPFERIELERTGCFGPCPAYTVTLNRDLTAEYDGSDFVERHGRFSGRVDPYDFARLAMLLERLGFAELEERYERSSTDAPTCFLRAWRPGSAEPITVTDYGRYGPIELWALQQAVDGVVAAIVWQPQPGAK